MTLASRLSHILTLFKASYQPYATSTAASSIASIQDDVLLLPNVRLPKKTVKSRLFGVRPDKGDAIIYSGERICGEIAAKPSSGQGPVPELFFIKQRAGRSAEVLKNLPPFTPTPSWAPALPPPGLAHASLGIIFPKGPLSFTAAFMEQWNKGYGSSKYSRDQEFEVPLRPLVWMACGLPLIRGPPVAMKGSRRRSSISPPLAFYSLRGCFNVDLCKKLFRYIQAWYTCGLVVLGSKAGSWVLISR